MTTPLDPRDALAALKALQAGRGVTWKFLAELKADPNYKRPSNNPAGRPRTLAPDEAARRKRERDALRDRRQLDRRCDIDGCGRFVVGRKSLCARCLTRKNRHGHAEVASFPAWEDLRPLHRLVIRWITTHPVPAETLWKLDRYVLSSEATYQLRRSDDWKPAILRRNRRILRNLMSRWSAPDAAKPRSRRNGRRKTWTLTQDAIAVLLTVWIWNIERDARAGWSPEICAVWHMLQMRKFTGTVSGSTRTLLAQVVSQHLGSYLSTEATAFIAAHEAQTLPQPKPRKAQPIKPTLPPPLQPLGERPIYRGIGDLDKIAAWEKLKQLHEEKARGA
jgi:hypothetical protein